MTIRRFFRFTSYCLLSRLCSHPFPLFSLTFSFANSIASPPRLPTPTPPQVSLLSLSRPNGLLRNALAQPEILLSLAIALLTLCFTFVQYHSGFPPAVSALHLTETAPAALLIAICLVYLRRGPILSKAAASMLRRSLSVQIAALKKHNPDVIVASSYGGAVAALLLAEGHWRGPTILLAPAFKRVAGLVQDGKHGVMPYAQALAALVARQGKGMAPLLLVHAPADDIVPFAHSEELALALPEVVLGLDQAAESDDHRLLSLGRSAAMQTLLDRVLEHAA